MKFRLLFVLCLVAAVVAGCNKPSNEAPSRAFDVNLLFGLTETQVKAVLGEPTPASAEDTFDSGYIRGWKKGELLFAISFNRSGYPTSYACYDFRKDTRPTHESLRQEFNVSPTDTRYKLSYGAPGKDGSVTFMNINPR